MPDQYLLMPTLVVAAVGSALVVALALAALGRRRSVPYLLVTLALGMLLARTGLGVLSTIDAFAPPEHHLLEHSLDVLTAMLLLGAVILTRSEPPTPNP